MEERVWVPAKVLRQIQILHPPSQSRFNLLKIIEVLDWSLCIKLLPSKFSLPHKILVVTRNFFLLCFQEVKDRHRLLVFQEELYVLRWVQFLLQFQDPLKYLIDHCLWEVKHLRFFALDQEIYVLSADFDASIEELVPNVFWLDLYFICGLLLATQ